jgi:phosphopentomutase
MSKKVTILVIDGLGIGSMKDAKDKNAKTLKSILRTKGTGLFAKRPVPFVLYYNIFSII